MKDASGQSTLAPRALASRQRQQQERQARVGILRNPNSPPVPPPRRARLMGKWTHLRSSRRPPATKTAATETTATQTTATQTTAAVAEAPAPQAGGLAGTAHGAPVSSGAGINGDAAIDMAALAAILDQPEPELPRRTPYAARFRGIAATPDAAVAPPRGATDDNAANDGSEGRAAPDDDHAIDALPEPATGTRRVSFRWRRWAGSLVALGLAGTIIAVSGLN